MANTNENDRKLFAQTPLLFLRPNTLRILSDFLDTQKILPSNKGFSRDWRGLASAADLNFEEINRRQYSPNPTKQIIIKWCEKNKSGTSRKISVQDFFDCIINQLDRLDLYDDLRVRGKKGISTTSYINCSDYSQKYLKNLDTILLHFFSRID